MKTFEYKTVLIGTNIDDLFIEKALNNFGAVGWELVSTQFIITGRLYCYLKRELNQSYAATAVDSTSVEEPKKVPCEHRNIMQNSDGHGSQQCMDCGQIGRW